MKMYKIRVTGEVLETVNATRRANVEGQVVVFGREPVYIRAAELPPQLSDDRYLHIKAAPSAPSVVVVIDLKSERVQKPTADDALPGPEIDLKSERVQEAGGHRRVGGTESQARLMPHPPHPLGAVLGAGRVFFPRRS